jgi:hypothetical protein
MAHGERAIKPRQAPASTASFAHFAGLCLTMTGAQQTTSRMRLPGGFNATARAVRIPLRRRGADQRRGDHRRCDGNPPVTSRRRGLPRNAPVFETAPFPWDRR